MCIRDSVQGECAIPEGAGHTDVLEHFCHQLDVDDPWHVHQLVPTRCEGRRNHLFEDGVLRSVHVHGAKNAILKEMVSATLAPGRHELVNVPRIVDVELMAEVLEHIGVSCTFGDRTLTLDTTAQLVPEAPLELVRKMRASIVVMGPLLARTGRACVAFPGGDDLGARPIDMHLSGLEKMGASFELKH